MRNTCLAVVIALGLFAPGEVLWGQTAAAQTSPATGGTAPVQLPAPAIQTESPVVPEAALDLRPRQPAQEDPPITQTWWFWGAVAGVVLTTVAVVLLAARPLDTPASDLGDMRAFRQ